MVAGEPLPGWSGRFLHSATMTFAHYDIAAGAAPLHEHQHEQEEVWHIVGRRRWRSPSTARSRCSTPAASPWCRPTLRIRARPRLPGHHRRLPAAPDLPGIVAGRAPPGSHLGTDCRPCTAGRRSSSRSCSRAGAAPPLIGTGHRAAGRRSAPPSPPCPRCASPTFTAASDSGSAPAVSGRITAPGGPYLYDSEGRVVFFHGVDAVYKYAPYELYPDPGEALELLARRRLAHGAARLQRRAPGHDVERAGAGHGAGQRPGHLRAREADQPGPVQPGRLRPLRGAPDARPWTCSAASTSTRSSTCTRTCTTRCSTARVPRAGPCAPNGVPSVDPPGRWSLEYATKAAGIAFHHFWDNNVRGDLQGQYDQVWGDVARAFSGNPWVLGYDPFNEPFSTSLIRFGDEHFDSQLECFYTGRGHIGAPSHGAPPLRCPADDPANGVVPTILANDPRHLIFDEPDNYASRGLPDLHRADGPAQPRLQRPHLLRCPQPGDRQPDRHRGLRRPGRALARRAGLGPPRDGLGRPTGRAGLVRHRVRRQQ